MSVDNLPALRTSTALVAIRPAKVEAPAPTLSDPLLITAFAGAICTASAAYAGQVPALVTTGAATLAVTVAGLVERRRERAR